MRHHRLRPDDLLLSRRDLLRRCGVGLGGLAFASLLGEAEALAGGPLSPKAAPLPARAKHVIHLFMNGGPSHVDTFDPKPALKKNAGKRVPKQEGNTSALPSPFGFKKHGQSGLEISDVFPRLATCADDLCVIRSMHTDEPGHEPALSLMNCGATRLVRPSVGSWVTYGLGTENQNLPGYVALCPGGLPILGAQNWRSAFLPGAFQGTHIDTSKSRVEELVEHVQSRHASDAEQRLQLDLLRAINREHADRRPEDARLDARLDSFELAYRMQMEATDAFGLNGETRATRALYGESVQGRQMLIARRLVERGVRYVQVWHGADQPWDSHEDIAEEHGRLAAECDGPIAALLTDLKARGLLDETLVVWGGEFGRTPAAQAGDNGGAAKKGRDHNSKGFSIWLAGGGVKGGHVHGATDEFGVEAIEGKVHVHDLHATMLHLLGFDHTKLTYRYAGRDFRLTDVEGRVVREILA